MPRAAPAGARPGAERMPAAPRRSGPPRPRGYTRTVSDASPNGPSRRVRRNRTLLVVGILLIAVLAVATGILIGTEQTAQRAAPSGTQLASDTPEPSAPRPEPTAEPEPPASVDAFDRAARSLDDPMSIWVVVNPQRPLDPVDFVPPDLVEVPVARTWVPEMRQEAADAVVAMFQAAADEAGFFLASNSAYRSYSTQVELYGDGSDPTTAKPGHSEHQLGLAIDIGTEGGCTFECMDDSAESEWLHANAHRFGFILRYPADKVDVTGYPWESWHYRYVGPELATEMHETGFTTLEEFFGLPPGAE